MVRAGPAAVVGAGPAVVGGGVVSGGWAEEDAAWGRWRVARGDPVLGAWAVGAVALEKGWLGSPPSPGPGDAGVCSGRCEGAEELILQRIFDVLDIVLDAWMRQLHPHIMKMNVAT